MKVTTSRSRWGPHRTSSPLIISGYANPRKNSYLKEALRSLITKQAVEKVVVRSSLAFYNQLFIVPKPNNKWRPILDLSRLNLFLKSEIFKTETPETIRLSLQQGEWVTSLWCLFPHSHQSKVEKVSQVSSKQSNLPVHGSAVWPSDSSVGVYKGCEGGKTDGRDQGYKDPPVPRQLVASSPFLGDLFRPNPDIVGLVPKARVDGQFEAVGTSAATGIQLCRLSFRPLSGSSQAHSRKVASPDPENKDAYEQRQLFCPSLHVSHRLVDSHREAGGFGSPAHEAHPMAPKESLAYPRDPGQEDTSS